jgi:transcriptional regulator with XRE-family HTH domain
LGYKSSSILSEIESGKKGLDAEKIPLLAEILGVSFDELFFD